MQKKTVKKCVLFSVTAVLLAVILFLLVMLLSNVSGEFVEASEGKNTDFFSSIARQNQSFQNAKVTDIAMLGAHDAFTSSITAASKSNTSEDTVANNGFLKAVAGGLIARNSKAQADNVYTQLRFGVRYLDVRITYVQQSYYTCHGLINDSLENGLLEVLKFLKENPGEFVVFHIQHYYKDSSTWDALAEYIKSVTYEGKNLYDYIHYKDKTSPGEITYAEATLGQSLGGIVMIAEKNNVSGELSAYFSLKEIRSNWHNENTTKKLLSGIYKEHQTLLENDSFNNLFRVNQAQLTPNMSEIFKMMFDWSLLDLAKKHNIQMLEDPQFLEWLTTMPIFMVDFTTCMEGNFSEKVTAALAAFNVSKQF